MKMFRSELDIIDHMEINIVYNNIYLKDHSSYPVIILQYISHAKI